MIRWFDRATDGEQEIDELDFVFSIPIGGGRRFGLAFHDRWRKWFLGTFRPIR